MKPWSAWWWGGRGIPIIRRQSEGRKIKARIGPRSILIFRFYKEDKIGEPVFYFCFVLDGSIPVAMRNVVQDLEARPETVRNVDRQRSARKKICGILVDKIRIRIVSKLRIQGGLPSRLLSRWENLLENNIVSDRLRDFHFIDKKL